MNTPMTIDAVAQHLGLHAKTVLRYVRDGRLKATRIGKEYRVLRADLDAFVGERPAEPAVPRTRYVVASSVVDVDVISPAESDRITTFILAGLNARRGEGDVPRADFIYYPERARLRITITASLSMTHELLRMIDALLESGRAAGEH